MSTHHTALDRALNLARLSLMFGRVDRATRHEDGGRPETDTDHTVMLGLVACELAPANLDRARIATFALVHDLVEVYSGDTQTLVISPDAMAAKHEREAAARVRLVAELGDGSWLAGLLATYEQQREPEARFVRLIDKVLPKLTHAFNGCAAARALTDRAGFDDAHARQFQQYAERYSEFPEALGLLRSAMRHAEECWPASEATCHTDEFTAIEARAAAALPSTDDALALADAIIADEDCDRLIDHGCDVLLVLSREVHALRAEHAAEVAVAAAGERERAPGIVYARAELARREAIAADDRADRASRAAYGAWRDAGSPKSGPTYDAYADAEMHRIETVGARRDAARVADAALDALLTAATTAAPTGGV